MDKISLKRIQTAHPLLRDELLEIFKKIDERLTGKAKCRFSYVLRTFAEQDALFNKIPRVTKAKAGQSFHNYGLAVDIVLLIDGGKTASWNTVADFDSDGKADWMEIVEIFKEYGWTWGGHWNFKDDPHFEKTFGYTWRQLIALKQSKKVDSKGYVLLDIPKI